MKNLKKFTSKESLTLYMEQNDIYPHVYVNNSNTNKNLHYEQQYLQLEYIESLENENQYIDLNLNLYDFVGDTAHIKIEIEYMPDISTKQMTLFNALKEQSPYPGICLRNEDFNNYNASEANNYRNFNIIGGVYTSKFYSMNIIYSTNDIVNLTNNYDIYDKSKIKISYDRNSFSNSITVPHSKDNVISLEQKIINHTIEFDVNNKYNDIKTTLFASINSDNITPFRYFTGRLYYCKIYKDNKLVRDLVPALDKNHVTCLYDLLDNTCYYSLSENDFHSGRIIKRIKPVDYGIDKSNYTYEEIEYVDTASKNYIDNNLPVYTDINYNMFKNTDNVIIDIKYHNYAYYEGMTMQSLSEVGWANNNSLKKVHNAINFNELLSCGYDKQYYIGCLIRGRHSNHGDRTVEMITGFQLNQMSYLEKTDNWKTYVYWLSMGYEYQQIDSRHIILDGITQTMVDNIGNESTFIFTGRDLNKNPHRNFYGKLFTLKITKGGVLEKDIVAVRRISDNVIGLYDKISGDFYPSLTENPFYGGNITGNYY